MASSFLLITTAATGFQSRILTLFAKQQIPGIKNTAMTAIKTLDLKLKNLKEKKTEIKIKYSKKKCFNLNPTFAQRNSIDKTFFSPFDFLRKNEATIFIV